MKKSAARSEAKRKTLTLGLKGFEKISAVEGIRLTRGMKGTFRDLDRKEASAAERREVLTRKYGKP